jgi:uncharacterized protein (TIGR02118 family)
MHRLIALYNQPSDPDHFRRYLKDVHLPIVARFPGLRAMSHGFDAAAAGAEASPYFAIVTCDFDDEGAMQTALQSDAGQEAAADVPNYAGAGVTILTFPCQDYPLPAPGGTR